MNTSEAVSASLTAALVFVTTYYAWQSYRMANEMRKTRAMSILPRLALTWHAVGPMHTFIRIASVGPGPALDIDVEIVFVPKADGVAEIRRRVQTSLMTPGETADIMPVESVADRLMDTPTLAERYERVEMAGTMRDAAESLHVVDDALPDIAAWRQLREEAVMRWTDPNTDRALAKEFSEAFKTPIGSVVRAIDLLRAELRSRPELDE